jgi:Matrixin
MPANFAAVWRDSGFLASVPPFLVVPYDGINLVYLNGVRSLNIQQDLKFDRGNLTVKAVNAAEITRSLMTYSQNFPSTCLREVLALNGGMRSTIVHGSVLLSVEGSVSGMTASLEYIRKADRAKMDVLTARRRKVAVSFRFVRYQDEARLLSMGTGLTPPDAEGLLDVVNRLFLPSANIELTLKSAAYANVNQQLGTAILLDNFRKYIVPLRDQSAGLTVFFVGQWKGETDPAGSAFRDLNCVVLDDSPSASLAASLAPMTAWPPNLVTDDEIYYSPGRLHRPQSDRELHIVLAHEIAHILGAEHNNEQDNLMSTKRQNLKLSKGTIKAISGN